jgi:C4-type Zn-finger protein
MGEKSTAECPECHENLDEVAVEGSILHGMFECSNCQWEGESGVKLQGEIGHCPFCNSEETEYTKEVADHPEFVEDKVMFETSCKDCGGVFNEVHKLEFIGNHTIDAECHPENRSD